jgi:hypothetical protein
MPHAYAPCLYLHTYGLQGQLGCLTLRRAHSVSSGSLVCEAVLAEAVARAKIGRLPHRGRRRRHQTLSDVAFDELPHSRPAGGRVRCRRCRRAEVAFDAAVAEEVEEKAEEEEAAAAEAEVEDAAALAEDVEEAAEELHGSRRAWGAGSGKVQRPSLAEPK